MIPVYIPACILIPAYILPCILTPVYTLAYTLPCIPAPHHITSHSLIHIMSRWAVISSFRPGPTPLQSLVAVFVKVDNGWTIVPDIPEGIRPLHLSVLNNDSDHYTIYILQYQRVCKWSIKVSEMGTQILWTVSPCTARFQLFLTKTTCLSVIMFIG